MCFLLSKSIKWLSISIWNVDEVFFSLFYSLTTKRMSLQSRSSKQNLLPSFMRIILLCFFFVFVDFCMTKNWTLYRQSASIIYLNSTFQNGALPKASVVWQPQQNWCVKTVNETKRTWLKIGESVSEVNECLCGEQEDMSKKKQEQDITRPD